MSKTICLLIGHNYRRAKLHSLKHGYLYEKFICTRCHKNKDAPATPYTPMDMPPPS